MYSIIGGDTKTYGPVSADEVYRWIREGRADERTKIKPEGKSDWVELGTFPEFSLPKQLFLLGFRNVMRRSFLQDSARSM